MAVSVKSIDDALKEFDKTTASLDPKKPADMGEVTYREAHQTWFQNMWKEGIKKLKGEIVRGAEWLSDSSRTAEFKKLPDATQKEVLQILAEGSTVVKDSCPPDEYTWPTA